ncbi:MAG: aspartate kinase [Acidobacteria bacterium]|nr:aspartate kinase [Acidobacteriota bacterium]
MQRIVQKFGGSSVATAEKLRHVASKIAHTRRSGAGVVVVVSAMGKTTDELLGLAARVSDRPMPRELDLLLASGEQISSSLLAMAVQNQGQEAVALTGAQSGIVTSDGHGGAKVTDVQPDRILDELDQGRVVVVAGFQGLNPSDEVATLGRGGSDTSAVALASALDAGECQIFTDVAGVYSADPRVVPSARCIERIDYEQMLALAHHGARVLHAEAVELAQRDEVIVQVRSTFSDAGGTRVGPAESDLQGVPVSGIAGRQDLLAIIGHGSELEARVLDRAHSEAGTDRDVLWHEPVGADRRFRLLVASQNMPDPEAFAGRLTEEMEVDVVGDLGSVSVVGRQLERHADLHERVGPLSDQALHNYSTPVSLSWLLRAPHVDEVSRHLHEALVEPAFAPSLSAGAPRATSVPA